MTYAWIIDTDHLDGEANGLTGPYGADEALIAKLTGTTEGDKFRMYDDDEELYYSGRFTAEGDDYDMFEPLDDFGMPNAGCTSIKYLEDGKWSRL